jgi:predicted metal-dependent hydrolase
MMNYELIRSRRKTMSLEITKDHRLLVRAPIGLSQDAIDTFVEKHEPWAKSALLPCPLPFRSPRLRRSKP